MLQARGCLPHPPLPGEYLSEEEWGLKGPVSVLSLTQESLLLKDYSVCPCLHGGSPVRGHGGTHGRPRDPEEECFQSAAPS